MSNENEKSKFDFPILQGHARITINQIDSYIGSNPASKVFLKL